MTTEIFHIVNVYVTHALNPIVRLNLAKDL